MDDARTVVEIGLRIEIFGDTGMFRHCAQFHDAVQGKRPEYSAFPVVGYRIVPAC